MKKISIIIIAIMGVMLVLCIGLTACFSQQTYIGDEFCSPYFTVPNGCILYEIPGSGSAGEYSAAFNDSGQADAEGKNIFTITIGCQEGTSYTQVLSWSSNFPVYAVIVSGGDSFIQYSYSGIVRSDTNLSAPETDSGEPMDIEHVSILVYPGYFAAEVSEAVSTTETTESAVSTTSQSTTTTKTNPSATSSATVKGTTAATGKTAEATSSPVTGDSLPMNLLVLSISTFLTAGICTCRWISMKK